MALQHLPEAGVHPAFDHVGGRRPLASVKLLELYEAEQGLFPDELVQPSSRLPQALVGIDLLAVLEGVLLQKRFPSAVPFVVVDEPCGRIRPLFHPYETLCELVELFAAFELGPGGGLPLHLAERMEQAALDLRRRPIDARRFAEPGGSVDHGQGRRRDARQKSCPALRLLASREMPGHDVLAGAGYEDDHVAAEPYAVQEHDVVDLSRGGADGPYPPELGGPPLERRPRIAHLRLGRLGQKPPDEKRQPLRGGVYGARLGAPAALAAEAPPSGGRGPVPLHRASARTAPWIVHGSIPSSGNFLHEKACLTRHVKGKSDTHSGPVASWFGSTYLIIFSSSPGLMVKIGHTFWAITRHVHTI